MVNLRIATSENWRDKATGERQERTEWHNVVIYNENLGKIAEQYLKKGSKVYVEGQLQTRKWQDQSGADKYTTEVVLQRFRGELTILDRAATSRTSGGSGDFGRAAPRGRAAKGAVRRVGGAADRWPKNSTTRFRSSPTEGRRLPFARRMRMFAIDASSDNVRPRRLRLRRGRKHSEVASGSDCGRSRRRAEAPSSARPSTSWARRVRASRARSNRAKAGHPRSDRTDDAADADVHLKSAGRN